ncbi:MAG: tRNA (adenosine(37)-N6)-dimethylallyltransferase MiaA [Clostridia bacterium]|nr:tRNA (adenosine(37)-N6)-dimethylallyltransferase MiaA [Clostridia bacterium]
MSIRPKVICIVGPTACGKTALSVALAKRLSGEIVSADAVAVYRGMDIGSAKPNEQERQGIPHHMIDCVDVTDENFTVSVFRNKARDAIDGILARQKTPIIVGGSGLYLDSVFSDMRFSAPSDSDIRASIEKEYDNDPKGLFESLRRADPKTAERLHPNDKKRVVRAIEVLRITGKPFSALNRAFETAQHSDDTYDVVRIGLNMYRSILYERIDQRVDQMIEQGLKQEAFSFFDRGLTPDTCRAMQSIGYAQLYDVYTGRETLDHAIEQIKLDTRHFAKRQLTWFKRNAETTWLDPTKHTMDELVLQIMELMHEH